MSKSFSSMGNKSNSRRFTGGGPRPDNADYKQSEVKVRSEAWAKLTPAEQLAALDRRLGKDQGAKKQRDRIKAKMSGKPVVPRISEASVAAQVAEANAAVTGSVRLKAKERRALERAERFQK